MENAKKGKEVMNTVLHPLAQKKKKTKHDVTLP